jgi:hypothetical protein
VEVVSKKQQVDLEVQQVRHRPVDRLGQLALHLQQPVHGPVAGVVVDRVEAREGDSFGHPAGGGQLGERLQGPVGDQGEDDPLDAGIEASPGEHGVHRLVDPETSPQPVQRPRPAQRLGRHERQRLATGAGLSLQLGLGPQVAGDRADQAAQGLAVEVVLPAEAVDDLGHRAARLGVADVVGQLYVANDRPVLVPPLDRPQVHAHTIRQYSQWMLDGVG